MNNTITGTELFFFPCNEFEEELRISSTSVMQWCHVMWKKQKITEVPTADRFCADGLLTSCCERACMRHVHRFYFIVNAFLFCFLFLFVVFALFLF